MYGTGAYIAYKMIQDAYREADEISYERWKSYTEEQKQAIIEFDLEYYEYKRKKEQEEYKKLCKFLKKILTPFIILFDYIVEFYFYLIFKKIYGFKSNYIFIFKKDFLKNNLIFQPIKYINLNDYETIGKILINFHNTNFKKTKILILVKYRNFEDRMIYLNKLFENCNFLTKNDMYKITKIFKNNLIKKY